MKRQWISKQDSITYNRNKVENIWLLVKLLFFVGILLSIFVAGPSFLSSTQSLLSYVIKDSLSPIICNGIITNKYFNSKLKNNHEQFVYKASSFLASKNYGLDNSKKLATSEQAADYQQKGSITLIKEDSQKIIVTPSWVALKNM
jgi:predicted PurR-regulated permease PerM